MLSPSARVTPPLPDAPRAASWPWNASPGNRASRCDPAGGIGRPPAVDFYGSDRAAGCSCAARRPPAAPVMTWPSDGDPGRSPVPRRCPGTRWRGSGGRAEGRGEREGGVDGLLNRFRLSCLEPPVMCLGGLRRVGCSQRAAAERFVSCTSFCAWLRIVWLKGD